MSIQLDQLPAEFRLGHEAIDGQHEILFQLYRELGDYCQNAEYDVDLELILLSLKTYVDTHFRFEEDLMGSMEYQGLAAHRTEHHELERQVDAQVDRFHTLTKEDEIKAFALGLKQFLYKWLTNHIAETDRKLCQSLH